MISNNTTNLDTKSSYTSVEKPAAAPVSRSAPAETVAVASTVVKEAPVEQKPNIQEQIVERTEKNQEQRDEVTRRVAEAIPKVRELLQKNQRSLDFEVAERENRVIITVIDKETEKVIRQIPPEDVLQIAEAIDQGLEHNLGGIIFNSKA